MQSLLTISFPGSVSDLCFSPDGSRLASALPGGRVAIFDAVTGREEHGWNLQEAVGGVAWSPTGDVLAATVGRARVAILSPTRGSRVDHLHVDEPISLAFTSDGSELLVGRATAGVVAFTMPQGQRRDWGLADLPGPVWRLRLVRDTATFAICHRTTVRFEDTRSRETLSIVEFDPHIAVQDCVLFRDSDSCAAALHFRRGGTLGRTQHPNLYEIAIWPALSGVYPHMEWTLLGHEIGRA